MNNMYQVILNKIKNQDYFGDPVKIAYKGRNSHPTYLGGICSSISSFSFVFYFIWRIHLF